MKNVEVFIVDDSAVIRQVLGEIIDKEAGLELLGVAPDPLIAIKKMEKHWPDVILLDIAMPKMDGIAFLKQIMSTKPTPVVICSAKTEDNPTLSLEALSSGAVEVINKPQSQLNEFLYSAEVKQILRALKQAAATKVKALKFLSEQSFRQRLSADVVIQKQDSPTNHNAEVVIVIGASTGGTEAVERFLKNTDSNTPPIVIVQHMPEKFTTAFAQRLDQSVALKVSEAHNNIQLQRGNAYIAPGGIHTVLNCLNGQYFLELKDGPLVSRHKPSVDVLFRSAAQCAGQSAIGVVLTGMGDDGAQGCLELHQAGAVTFAQDEDSSLVYGMPKEAIDKGGVKFSCSLDILPFQVQRVWVKHEELK
ncbi:protein-glutamate methylesterase/protein-glutamine glutaminase [Vibrio sp. TRT 21S02]|uniref:protein-glutamate methylesterase/protein-glutamine glutaminase n=1 Tax=Vibrio sp. TRT 21S02 TaxID=3418507 RepID=UPI003CF136A5